MAKLELNDSGENSSLLDTATITVVKSFTVQAQWNRAGLHSNGRLLALPANFRQGCKQRTKGKRFITLMAALTDTYDGKINTAAYIGPSSDRFIYMQVIIKIFTIKAGRNLRREANT